MKFDKQVDRRKVYGGLLIGAGAVIVYCLLTNLNSVKTFINWLLSCFAPVTLGLLLAYVMRPMAACLEKWLPKFIKSEKARLNIGSICAFIIVLLIIAILIWLVIPQLLYSASGFVNNFDDYLNAVKQTLDDWSEKLGITNPLAQYYNGSENKLINEATKWLSDNFSSIMSAVVNFGAWTVNFVIALMVALYALLDRQHLKYGVLRCEEAILGKRRSERLNVIVRRGDRYTMTFLGSNLIDALIIGIANFIFLSIMKSPYTPLLAVILGVTNYIPTFGPVIGGVIAGAILLLVKPDILLVFIIFTLILQQLDGNVIKPLLFGDSTGLSPFWVLVAIVVGGRMFGMLGMILGVPFVALIRSVLTETIDKRIAKREAAEGEQTADADN